MRPVDPTLIKAIPALRRYLITSTATAIATAALIVAQAATLAHLLATIVHNTTAIHTLNTTLALLTGIIALRATLNWATNNLATRTATHVKTQLRHDLLNTAATNAPTWAGNNHTSNTVTLTTRGVDAIDAYITGYLPQLTLAACIPITISVIYAFTDIASLIIVAITVPLIPIFGILIGWHTQAKSEQQWHKLTQLGGHFLDHTAGLATLRIFGRAKDQTQRVRETADNYRTTTMETLRVAFLSALVLELVATLSVALIAVPTGLRLLDGDMNLHTAFLILLLAPEIYLPLRAMGTQYHAAREGLTAITEAHTLTRQTTPATIRRKNPMHTGALTLNNLTAHYEGRNTPALHSATAELEPGEIAAITGPSGAGKTTILNALLGFAPITTGHITLGGTTITPNNQPDALHLIAWVPQRPHLFAMSLADNIRLGQPHATTNDIKNAADQAAITPYLHELPNGLDTILGEAGHGLSAGQTRRLALARAFLRINMLNCPYILLDEPTASLDTHTEQTINTATTELLTGRTALIVAHKPAILELATTTWHVNHGTLTTKQTSHA